jgi:hypothetical protein
MLLTKREREILRVYETACAALQRRCNRKEIAYEAYLAGIKQLKAAYDRDLAAAEEDFYADNTWENGRLAL